MLLLMRIEGQFLVRYHYFIRFADDVSSQKTYDPAPVMMQTCHQLYPAQGELELTLCASLSLPVAILSVYDLVE